MQVIGVQFDIAWENKPANFEQVRSLLKKTSVEPGALIVLPEMLPPASACRLNRLRNRRRGRHSSFLRNSRDTGAYVLAGVVTRGADGRGRNEALVVDPQEKEICAIASCIRFHSAAKTSTIPRRRNVFVRLGAVSGDPVCLLRLAISGNLPASNPAGRPIASGDCQLAGSARYPLAKLLRARAIENQAYVIGVNPRATIRNWSTPGTA